MQVTIKRKPGNCADEIPRLQPLRPRVLRYTIVALVAWTLLVGASLAWNVSAHKRCVLKDATAHARVGVEQDISYGRWNAELGGVYAKVEGGGLDASGLQGSIQTTVGNSLTLISPDSMTRQVHEMCGTETSLSRRFVSANPINPKNAPDKWERAGLEAFARGDKEASTVVTQDGERRLRFMQPLFAADACMKCHREQGYKLGDIQGAVSVSMPLAPFWQSRREQSAAIAAGHVVVWLLGAAGIVFAARIIARNLRERDRVQKVLSASEERHRAIFDTVQAGILVIDAETHDVVDANPEALRITGGKRDEVVGHSCHKNICPAEKGKCPITDEGQEFDNAERMLLAIDGELVPVQKTVVPMALHGRKYLVECFVDMRERKRAEEALERSERQFLDIFHKNADAAMLLDQRRIVDCNEKMVELMRERDKEALLASDVIKASFEVVENGRSAHETAEALVTAAYATGVIRKECVISPADGKKFPAEITMMPVPLFGRQILYCIIKDLSTLRRAEERVERDESARAGLNQLLELSLASTTPEDLLQGTLEVLAGLDFLPRQERSAALLSDHSSGLLNMRASRNLTDAQRSRRIQTPLGHCPCGRAAAEGRVQWRSAAEMAAEDLCEDGHGSLYCVPVRIEGQTVAVLELCMCSAAEYKAEDAAFLEAAADAIAGALQRLAIEDELRRGNAMMIDALASEKRAAMELEAAMTQLENAKREAVSANQAKSEFLANMSHEIRTPMTAILGYAENIAETAEDAEIVEAIATIRRNGEYLLDLINDILDLSKIEASKMVLERIECNPCRIVAETATLMQVRADAKGLPLAIEYDGPIPAMIRTDPTRVRQTLINLLGNSIKFTEQGEIRLIVKLDAEADEPHLQFDVVDTGVGMSAEQASRMFQPFTQADTSTTRQFGGTGLGLTICKRLADLLGGSIDVVETAPGQGTRMRFSIATGSLDGVRMVDDPTRENARPADKVENETSICAASLIGRRVLIAEDGPDNQRLIAYILKKAGAEVFVADNGQIAVDAATTAEDEGRAFDLILMDIQMPVMDGYEATRELRERGCTTPIVALTAHAMATDREKCISAGCNDYASKPVDRRKLIATICNLLQEPQPAA